MADGKATVRDYSTFGARRLAEAVLAHCDSLDDVGAFPNASACARELVNRVAKHLDAIGNTTDLLAALRKFADDFRVEEATRDVLRGIANELSGGSHCIHTLNALGHCTRCGARPNDAG